MLFIAPLVKSRTGALFHEVFSQSRQGNENPRQGSRRRMQRCHLLWQIMHYNVLRAMVFRRWGKLPALLPAGTAQYLTADISVVWGPRDVILSFINHFPKTQISAPSCEQTSFTSASSRHWNPPQQAAGRCSDPHVYLSFQWTNCSSCQSCLVPPPVKKNKARSLRLLVVQNGKKKQKGVISLVMMK